MSQGTLAAEQFEDLQSEPTRDKPHGNPTEAHTPDRANFSTVDRKALRSQIRALSRVNNGKAAMVIGAQWLVMAVATAVFVGLFAFFSGTFSVAEGLGAMAGWQIAILSVVYFCAICVIASRQHALGIVMHDGSHFRVFSHRKWNDILTDLTCSFPILLSTSLYRHEHLDHHMHTSEDDDPYWVVMQADPDWHWPKPKSEAIKLFAADVLGLNIPKWGKTVAPWSPLQQMFKPLRGRGVMTLQERIMFVSFWATIAVLLTLTQTWLFFVLLWVVPLFTILNAFVRFRSVAEHLALQGEDELNKTRHVDATWIERLTISPLNINIHIAHHMFPSVPQYNLPELHRLLMTQPSYRDRAKIYGSYLNRKSGVIADLIE